jgi:hypothetical protein
MTEIDTKRLRELQHAAATECTYEADREFQSAMNEAFPHLLAVYEAVQGAPEFPVRTTTGNYSVVVGHLPPERAGEVVRLVRSGRGA